MQIILIALFTVIFLQAPCFAFDNSAYQAVFPNRKESKWLDIPWRLNIMEARVQSQSSGKPIFLWLMDGHVLGST